MKFAALIEYIQDKDKIQSIRPTHRQYLESGEFWKTLATWQVAHIVTACLTRRSANKCIFVRLFPKLFVRKELQEFARLQQYLTRLLAEGKLAIAGPFTDDWGAMIVYEAASADEALALLQGDPFHAAGVFVRWTIRPWNTVMANRELLPG